MTEDQIQAKSYQWLHNTYPHLRGLFFAVPNGGSRDKREGMKMKSTGTVPGIPDCILISPEVTGFEFKTQIGSLSPVQTEIHKRWHLASVPVYVVRSFEQFKEIIEHILQKAGY